MELKFVLTQDEKRIHMSALGARTLCDQRVWRIIDSKKVKTSTCPVCKREAKSRA